jgi:hypothetical protein
MLNNDVELNLVGMREKFPITFLATYMSSKDGVTMADSDIGLISYMQSLADATDTPQTRNLIPFSDITPLLSKNCLFVHQVTFFAFDPTIAGLSDTADDIIASQLIDGTTVTRSYPQSNYLNGAMPVVFQPNFFRPAITIDGNLINQGFINGPKGAETNKGYKSLGIPMNTCIKVGKVLDRVSSIEISTAFAQYVASQTKFQNYPVQAIVEFWIED